MITEFANSPEMATALSEAMQKMKDELTADLPKRLASVLESSA
jgi:hypothetical protein